MAIEVIQRVIDDVDGVPVEEDAADALVEFSIGRKHYEMHLSAANRLKFEEQMAYYVDVAREVKQHRHHKKTTTKKQQVAVPVLEAAPVPRCHNRKVKRVGIKAWAVENGYDYHTGRVPVEIADAYDEAHS